MKYVLFLFMLPVIIFSSCSKEMPYEEDFLKSEKAFHNFKQQNNNSYTFVLSTYSWTNFSSETTIHVKNGKIVGRDYIAKQGKWINDKWEFTILEEYIETEGNVNTHINGLTAITLDEVYQKTKNELLKVDGKQNTIYFEAKNNGMISSVGYVPNNCADDCFMGYTISRIVPFTNG